MGGGIICTTQILLLALALGGLLLPNEAAGQQNNDMLSNIFGVTLNDFQDNDVYYFPCAGTPCVPICWDACAVGANAYLEMPNGTLYTLFLQGLHLAEFVVCPPTIDVACAEPLQADGCWHFWSGAVPSQWTNGNYPYPVPIDGTCYFEQSGQYLMEVFMWADANSDGIPEQSNSNPMGWYVESDSPTCINILNETYEPSVQIEPATNICLGETVTIVISSPLDGIDQVQWTWTQPDGTEGDILGVADCGVFPNPPVTACQAIEITPTMTGTQTITLNMTNFASGDNCPENLFAETLQIEVSNDACCIDPNGPCCLEPDGTACCIAQAADNYQWFDGLGTALPLGVVGTTQNYSTLSGTHTWAPGAGNHPFAGYAGTESDPIRINGDLNINFNSEINMNNLYFEFGPKGRVQVLCNTQTGGNLILDDCRFRGDPICQTMWQGIRVQGPGQGIARVNTPGGATRNYAKVIAQNQTKIEQAIIGIAGSLTPLIDLDDLHTWTYATLNPLSPMLLVPSVSGAYLTTITDDMPTTYGGVCMTNSETTFSNCLQGIHLRNFVNTNTNGGPVCAVTNTTFTSTGELWYPFDQVPNVSRSEVGIELLGYKNLTVLQSDPVGIPNFANLKYGIRSIASHQINLRWLMFDQNNVGVSSLGVFLDPLVNTFNTTYCTFNECRIGIQATGSNMRILENRINPIPAGTTTSGMLTDLGILLRGCLFDVRHNEINQSTIGIGLLSNRKTPNLVKLNRFTFDVIDVWAFGDNGNIIDGGTQITCNNFDLFGFSALLVQPYNPPSPTPVLPPDPGSLDDQGDCDPLAPDEQHPADNSFAPYNAAWGLPHIFADASVPDFTYFARPDAGGITYVPQNVSTNVNVEMCTPPIPVEENCSGTPPKPPGQIKIISDEWERNREAFKLLQSYWEEGADSATIAALFDDLQTEESRLRMLPYYVVSGDAAKYNDAMNNLPDSDTDTYYLKQLYQLYWQVQQSGRTYMQLTAAEEVTVRQIAHSGSRAAFEAHALLYMLYGEEFEIPLPLLPDAAATFIGTNNLGSIAFKMTNNNVGDNYLKVMPNPANSNIIMAALPQGKTGHISLYAIDGRLLLNANIDDKGELSLDLNSFGNGVYMLRLQLSDGTTANQKLVIAR